MKWDSGSDHRWETSGSILYFRRTSTTAEQTPTFCFVFWECKSSGVEKLMIQFNLINLIQSGTELCCAWKVHSDEGGESKLLQVEISTTNRIKIHISDWLISKLMQYLFNKTKCQDDLMKHVPNRKLDISTPGLQELVDFFEQNINSCHDTWFTLLSQTEDQDKLKVLSGFMFVLPERDSSGRKVIFHIPRCKSNEKKHVSSSNQSLLIE